VLLKCEVYSCDYKVKVEQIEYDSLLRSQLMWHGHWLVPY